MLIFFGTFSLQQAITKREECHNLVGKTHFYAGLCAGAAFAVWADLPLLDCAAAAAAGILGGLAPDLDHRKSKITQKTGMFGFVSSRMLKHRGVLHAPILYVVLAAVLFPCIGVYPLTQAAVCGLLAGALSHLFLDALNPSGIPLLWPLLKKRISLLPIQTGGRIDRLIGRLCLLGAAWCAVCAVLS